MPTKNPVKAEVNTFVKGLITEASPLNFPANASLDEENFELNRDGTRNRRLGFDFEPENVLIPAPVDATTLSTPNPITYKWTEVGGNAGLTFLVVQIDNVLMFYDLDKDSLSSEGYVGTITLTDFPKEVKFSFAAINGKLVVVSGSDLVYVITYDSVTGFASSSDTLKTRDLWGIEETDVEGIKYENDPLYRGDFSGFHYYNLQNQSWAIPRKNSANFLIDPVYQYVTDLLKYPSNSEVVWPGLQFQPVSSGTPFERLYTNLYTEVLGGDTVAPKGHYIIDVVKRGATRVSAVAKNRERNDDIPTDYIITFLPDYTDGGSKIVTEFAGRVFFGGFSGKTVGGDKRSPSLSNYIFFSQLITNNQDIYKCYQLGDPTSRDNNDIVDTDGGFIRIAGADNIIALVNVSSALLVIATNGVWSVTGGAEYGFSATNYKVDKISTFGGIGPFSVIEEKGRLFYWAKEGIYVVGKDQLGSFGSESLTESTIQSFYEAIPSLSKEGVIGTYDPIGKKLRWLYQIATDEEGVYEPNELVFDLILNAFYKNRIFITDNHNVQVVGMFSSTIFNSVASTDTVYVLGDVVNSSTDEVLINISNKNSSNETVKYLCLVRDGSDQYFTFGFYRNTTFRDWQRYDGVGKDARAYLITGDSVAGDSSVQKQVQYLTMHFKRTEPDIESGCLGRIQWDWSRNSLSRKWSSTRQYYRYSKLNSNSDYDESFDVLTTKNLVRGRGRAFALYIESEPDKDLRLLGWSVAIDGNGKV